MTPPFSESVSVVMPAFNLERVIRDSIIRTEQRLSRLGCSYEILVIDDGSRDATRRIAMSAAGSHIRVLGYNANQGKGYALKMGALSAKGDFIVLIDGDSDINIDLVERYILALRDADIVVGSKRHPDSVVVQPVLRKFLSLALNILVRLMTGIRLWDTQVGFKAFRHTALVDIMNLVSVRRFAFDVEVLTIASLLKKRIVVMPVEIRSDALFSARNIIRMLIDILGITYRLRIKRWYQKNYRKAIPPEYHPIIRW